MRSPGSRRSLAEQALRVASLAALTALAVRLWFGTPGEEGAAVVRTASLDSALSSWSQLAPRQATLHATIVPDARQRDWLVALRRTGSVIRWTTGDTTGTALVMDPGPLAQGTSRVVALGAAGSAAILADPLGQVDSTSTGRDGVATWLIRPLGAISVALGASRPVTGPRDSVATRPVLVIGRAGWESKFVVAALEEDGWTVATRISLAPGAVVRQGSAATIDTASLSAVVVLDSTSALDAAVLAAFVNEGGGVLASGSGARHPALRTLLPRATAEVPGTLGGLLGPAPREGLNARTFAVSNSAVTLERRGDAAVVAGRRVGSGRVLVMGYDDTWRTRMAPPDEGAPAAHRAWWSSLVASVAHIRLLPREAPAVDEAPFASMVAALGPPVAPGQLPGDGPAIPWDALLALAAVTALLAEWLSRRLRGVA